MDTTLKEAAATPMRGEVKPIHTFCSPRRGIDEDTVADLGKALERDGGFLHPIAVRTEGPGRYRLIAGLHRLEAWERCFGNQRPIPAIIYPSGTPDARITMLEIQENLFRKELTAAEREAQIIRLAAELKKLNGGKPATPVSESGEVAESGNPIPSLSPASGGRGHKGVAQKVAEKARIGKRAVNLRVKAASAAIGEKIDLDGDTPEELERKADKRQRAEPKVQRPKRRKPASRVGVEDATQPAKQQDGELGSQLEGMWNSFNASGRAAQLRFIHDACLHLGFDPLKMASPAAFGLADEEPELAEDLPAERAPATDDAAVDSEAEQDDAAVAQAEQGDDAAVAEAEQGDDAADIGAEDLQDAGDDVPETADQEPGAATKCAYCNADFWSGDQRHLVNGRLYHDGFCLEYARQIAVAAEEPSRRSDGALGRPHTSRDHRADAQDESSCAA